MKLKACRSKVAIKIARKVALNITLTYTVDIIMIFIIVFIYEQGFLKVTNNKLANLLRAVITSRRCTHRLLLPPKIGFLFRRIHHNY